MSEERMPRWLSEPLVHFMIAGGALFFIVAWLDPAPEDSNVITVTQKDLLSTLQGRAQVYSRDTFESLLSQMNAEQRRELVRETVLEEALYREGRKLSLAEIDPVVRQRVVQQMQVLLLDDAAGKLQVSENDARAYYDNHLGQYQEPSMVGFTHVYFGKGQFGEQAEDLAQQTIADLVSAEIPVSQAIDYGGRFLYQNRYVNAEKKRIMAEFDEEFATNIFSLAAKESWQGPLESQHGWHIIWIHMVSDAQISPYNEVTESVLLDAVADRRRQLLDEAMDSLLDKYELHIEKGHEQL